MRFVKPLQKVEVIESTKQCKPGSIGYIACLKPSKKFGMWQASVVFTRFGKGGMNRLSQMGVSCEPIDVSQFKTQKTTHAVEEYLKAKRHVKPQVLFKYLPMDSKNLLEMDTWDFMGYVSALSILIDKLMSGRPMSGYYHGHRYFEDGCQIEENLEDIPIEYSGYAFCGLLGQIILKPYITDYFSNTENRKVWLKALHKHYASAVRSLAIIYIDKLRMNMITVRDSILNHLGLSRSEGIKMDPYFEIQGTEDVRLFDMSKVKRPMRQVAPAGYPTRRRINQQPAEVQLVNHDNAVNWGEMAEAVEEAMPGGVTSCAYCGKRLIALNGLVLDNLDKITLKGLPSAPINGDSFNVSSDDGPARIYEFKNGRYYRIR